jgi:hypothetical protein
MTVKELIIELLDCDMDATVDFDIDTSEEDINISDFDLHNDKRYVTLTIELKNYVLLDKKEYEELTDRLSELENA